MGLDPAIRVNAFRNLSMFTWGLQFLAQCTAAKANENTVAVLKIAMRSARLIEQLQQKLNLDFSYKTAGKLIVLASEKENDAARKRRVLKQKYGCETHVLSADEAAAMEPALLAMTQDFAGAVYSEFDEVGDAHLFARSITVTKWPRLEVDHGSSYRQVIDVGNWDAARMTNTPGQSGDPRSPFYSNLLKGWAEEESFPLVYTREKVIEHRVLTINLTPRQ